MIKGKMRKNKKGEMTSTTVIVTIILVIGFAVILYFFLRFLWNSNVDREVCHESVILRATMLPSIEEYVPLKCKTQKTCITSGSGKCEEELEGEKGIVKIKVKKEEDVEMALAREIADCWNMMGQGKVSLFTQYWAKNYGIGTVYPTCVICSRVAFDKSIEKGIDLGKLDLFDYMMKHKVPGKEETYMQYLGGKTDIGDEILISDLEEKNGKAVLSDKKETIKLEELEKKGAEEGKEIAVVFMQISAPEYSEVLKKTLGSVGGGLFVGGVLAPKTTTALAIGAVTSWWFWAGAAIFGTYLRGSVAWNRGITATYCGDISTGTEARNGCSVVRTVNYDAEELGKYCEVVESIP